MWVNVTLSSHQWSTQHSNRIKAKTAVSLSEVTIHWSESLSKSSLSLLQKDCTVSPLMKLNLRIVFYSLNTDISFMLAPPCGSSRVLQSKRPYESQSGAVGAFQIHVSVRSCLQPHPQPNAWLVLYRETSLFTSWWWVRGTHCFHC